MKREIKNDGEYVECDADQLVDRFSDFDQAQVVVLTKGRIELAGEDLSAFKTKYLKMQELFGPKFEGMNSQQVSDFILRKMLIDGLSI